MCPVESQPQAWLPVSCPQMQVLWGPPHLLPPRVPTRNAVGGMSHGGITWWGTWAQANPGDLPELHSSVKVVSRSPGSQDPTLSILEGTWVPPRQASDACLLLPTPSDRHFHSLPPSPGITGLGVVGSCSEWMAALPWGTRPLPLTRPLQGAPQAVLGHVS